ncbi:helix-turn-helix domain-containing protein [Magnetospirillum moscoviense]|uniref:helix-turn-helix domain-containing protein n=1 Tax=Magnetospirillum moscoviense TaxID=1437059 RepID=UPI0009EE6E97
MACERDYLLMMLERPGGHITQTAEILGITRESLWKKASFGGGKGGMAGKGV